MATLVSVLLLLLDVLVVALILQLVLYGLLRLLRLARRGRSRATEPESGFGEPEAATGTARKLRCDDCRSGWVGRPGTDASTAVLRFRRAARRRAERRQQPAPAWAAKQGWDRCPSCFSLKVRHSRHQGDVASR